MKRMLMRNKRKVAVGVGGILVAGTVMYQIGKKKQWARKNLRNSSANQTDDLIPVNHKYHVSDIDQLTRLLKNIVELDSNGAKDKRIFILFYAPWCPDCQHALPLVDNLIEKTKILDQENDIFIKCFVGSKAVWKDKNNVFRIDNRFVINSVPTLIQFDVNTNKYVGTNDNRLGEQECQNKEKLESFFSGLDN